MGHTKPPLRGVSGIALAALILGVLSLVFGAFTGIVAIALALFVLRGRNQAKTARDLCPARIGLVLGCLGLLVSVGHFWLITRHLATRGYRQSVDNMARIGEAIHRFSYSSKPHKLPPGGDPSDSSGMGLSWRVHILPFLGEEKLYRQFNLNEPWDSKHNLRLVGRMPDVYRSPACSSESKTIFLGVSSPSSMFNGTKVRAWRDVIDGTANTLMVVEASLPRAVIWTKPGDWQYDSREPTAGLGAIHSDGFLGVFGSGAVGFVKNDIATAVMRDMCVIDDWPAGGTVGQVYLGIDRFTTIERYIDDVAPY